MCRIFAPAGEARMHAVTARRWRSSWPLRALGLDFEFAFEFVGSGGLDVRLEDEGEREEVRGRVGTLAATLLPEA
jgi:hypothetical protein